MDLKDKCTEKDVGYHIIDGKRGNSNPCADEVIRPATMPKVFVISNTHCRATLTAGTVYVTGEEDQTIFFKLADVSEGYITTSMIFYPDNGMYEKSGYISISGIKYIREATVRELYDCGEARVLNLTLSRRWFDMIASGEKKEEYREIKKYWISRLTRCKGNNNPELTGFFCKKAYCTSCIKHGGGFHAQPYDVVRFVNGYKPDSPSMVVVMDEICIGMGKPEWGAVSDEMYFVIKLGDVLYKK